VRSSSSATPRAPGSQDPTAAAKPAQRDASSSAFRNSMHHASTGALDRCFKGHDPGRRLDDALDFPDDSDSESDNDAGSVHSLECTSVARSDAHSGWTGGWLHSDGRVRMRPYGVNSLPAGALHCSASSFDNLQASCWSVSHTTDIYVHSAPAYCCAR
jgi:hypothetical protein